MRQRTGETTKHHALRHAGATAAYLATRDLRAVQMFLGHAPMSTTQQHLHLDQDAL
ncbi:tyrosine-type recombinase/integrase, partial [Agrococcus casei]